MLLVLISLSVSIWFVIVVLPWRPWATTELIDVDSPDLTVGNTAPDYLDRITVVIPARNEEQVLEQTLQTLTSSYPGLKIIVVDDNSTDRTPEIVQTFLQYSVTLLNGKPLEPGWSGKLWAQHQALQAVDTELILFLDADIVLKPGLIEKLASTKRQTKSNLVSLMVTPSLMSHWERLLMPAFIYFFKLIYPFRLSNRVGSQIAAAAGGCILMDSSVLANIGGLQSIRSALIDDCSLAKAVKSAGYKTWIGLTHSAWSNRNYSGLSPIWDMVARTAYTQLMYKTSLLMLCTFAMLILFALPVVNLFVTTPFGLIWSLSLLALILMGLTYFPTLRFYKLSPVKILELPLLALLYLMMTWDSALRYFRGERSRWKGRVYEAS